MWRFLQLSLLHLSFKIGLFELKSDCVKMVIQKRQFCSLCPTCTSLISLRFPDSRVMGRLWILQASSKLCLARRFCSKAVSALITSRWSFTNSLRKRDRKKGPFNLVIHKKLNILMVNIRNRKKHTPMSSLNQKFLTLMQDTSEFPQNIKTEFCLTNDFKTLDENSHEPENLSFSCYLIC